MMGLPERGYSREEIFGKLQEYAKLDPNPYSGRMFTIAFEPGVEELRKVVQEAFRMYMDKNILDFTEFRSAVKMEKDIVDIARSLMNAGEEVVGTYTFGGTESVFLAVKAARDLFILRKGLKIPEIVMPVTGHPCYDKAAEYMGLRVKRVAVDPETLEGVPEAVNEAVGEDTAMIVGSVPNWPFGTVDPIGELAEIAEERGVWMHVDACVGGFVLPFFQKLGEPLPEFDFRVPGVCSISLDPHKYAYSSLGASVVLFRKEFYKMLAQYANLRWPGYPIVNPAVLSSRSAGPLAATWTVLHYLGEAGYMDLTRRILRARKDIMEGLERLGFRIMGRPRSPLLAFTSPELNLFRLSDALLEKGWLVLPQIAMESLGIPRSLHLTLNPVHEKLSGQFLRELEATAEEVKREPPSEIEGLVRGMGAIAGMLAGEFDFETMRETVLKLEKYIEVQGPQVLKAIGVERGLPKDMSLIYELFEALPPEVTELLLNYAVAEIFRRGLG